MSTPAWQPDPTGRHQYRWWDGQHWSHHVADDGVATSDLVTGLHTLPSPPGPGTPETSQFHLGGRMAEFGDGRPVTLASPGVRLGARLVNLWIMIFLWIALLFPTAFAFDALGFWEKGSWPGVAIYWHFVSPVFLVGLLYEVTMISAGGRTLGKMATGIHVIRKDTGDRPGPSRSIRRWAIPGLLLLIPFVGWLATLFCRLSLTWGTSRQGWHDMAGGTLVVVKQSR